MRIELLLAVFILCIMIGLGLQGNLQFTSWESSFSISFNQDWQMIDAKAVILPTSLICGDQHLSFSLGQAVLLARQPQSLLLTRYKEQH